MLDGPIIILTIFGCVLALAHLANTLWPVKDEHEGNIEMLDIKNASPEILLEIEQMRMDLNASTHVMPNTVVLHESHRSRERRRAALFIKFEKQCVADLAELSRRIRPKTKTCCNTNHT